MITERESASASLCRQDGILLAGRGTIALRPKRGTGTSPATRGIPLFLAVFLLLVGLLIFSVVVQAQHAAAAEAWSAGVASGSAAQLAAPAAPGIAILKGPEIQQVRSGQEATFSIVVTNTGDVVLTNVNVSDPSAPACGWSLGELAPDEAVSFQCPGVVTEDLVNVATVTGEGPGGEIVQASDSAEVDVTPSTFIYDDVPASPISINFFTECFSGDQILREFQVGESFTVGDVDFGFNANHVNRDEIWAFLISPSGTRVELTSDDLLQPPIQNYDMLLDDSSTNPINDGSSDDTGEPYYDRDAKPFRPLSAFNGEDSLGTWVLEVCDKLPLINYGTYNRSRLILRDDALTADKTTQDVILKPGDSIDYSITISNNGPGTFGGVSMSDVVPAGVAYRAGTLAASSGTASESGGVITWNGDIGSLSEVLISFSADLVTTSPGLIANTAQIAHPVLAAPLNPTQVSQVFTDQDYLYTNETDLVIPDGGPGTAGCVSPVVSEITVPDSFFIGDLRVGLTADHTLRGDLVITLTSPSGITTALLSEVGFDENVDAMITDAGPDGSEAFELGVHDTGAPYYDVEGQTAGPGAVPLSVFDGEQAQGTWTLWICDAAFVDTGVLRRWSLFFREANVWLGNSTSWNTASNWSKGSVPDMSDFALIFPDPVGGNFPVLDTQAAVATLLVKGGASVDLDVFDMTAEDYVSNRGKLAQINPVTSPGTAVEFLHITNDAATEDKYFGLTMTPTLASMGDVSVEVRGNQAGGCTGVNTDALVRRCFHVEPAQPTTSAMQFYFTEAERNQQESNALKVWNRGDPPVQWRQVGTAYSYSEEAAECASANGQVCWVAAEGVDTYPLMTLGSRTPPVVGIGPVGGSTIELSWSHGESGVDHYEVWRASSPYFNPTMPGASKLADVAVDAGGSYTYPDGASGLGDPTNNSFYVVRTVYGTGQTTDANIVGAFDVGLVPGE